MAATEGHVRLQYPPDWITLGIVTTADIHRNQEECAAGDDPHPEHYRWRAFSRFVAVQSSLPSLLAHQLYALGATDADPALGGSIMAEVLRHRDCPHDLLRSALASDQTHLQRIAAQRLNQNDRNA